VRGSDLLEKRFLQEQTATTDMPDAS